MHWTSSSSCFWLVFKPLNTWIVPWFSGLGRRVGLLISLRLMMFICYRAFHASCIIIFNIRKEIVLTAGKRRTNNGDKLSSDQENKITGPNFLEAIHANTFILYQYLQEGRTYKFKIWTWVWHVQLWTSRLFSWQGFLGVMLLFDWSCFRFICRQSKHLYNCSAVGW